MTTDGSAGRRRMPSPPSEAQGEPAGVEHLDGQSAADLHLALVEGGVGAGSAAGRPVPHGVGAELLEQVHGGDHVALATSTSSCGRGRGPIPRWPRCATAARRARDGPAATVENSQVRMMSWAWGRRSMGKVRANRSSSSPQPVAIWGVSDDVAHVSMTSGSPTKPPGLAALGFVVARAARRRTGRRAVGRLGARIGWSWSGAPSASTGYQSGNGTPKKRCRLIEPVAVEAFDPVARSAPACAAGASAAPWPRCEQGAVAGRCRRGHRCACTTGGWPRSPVAGRPSRRTSPGG